MRRKSGRFGPRGGGWLWLRAGIAVALLALGSGCATSRGELDIRVPAMANPANGAPVKIVSVMDRRVFQISPPSADIPSLKDDDITNKAITSRAVARKRNAYGKALGDILLPEGRTVEMLVKEALTRAFREAGYRVLEPGDADYETALPVSAEIEQFWSWFTPGFWAITLEFEARVKISGPVAPFHQGEVVRGYARVKSGGATSSIWTEVIHQGLEDLIGNIKTRLQKRAAYRAAPPPETVAHGASFPLLFPPPLATGGTSASAPPENNRH